MTTHIPYLTLPAAVFSQPAVSVVLPIALGFGQGLALQPKQTKKTYLALKQPPFRPPPQVFGPAWFVLYGLMGFSAYHAWNTGMASVNPNVIALTKQGATLYTIQLGLNLAFMPLFYGLNRPIEATANMVALTGVLGYLTYIWSQVDEVAAWTMVPYVGWSCFATYLSAGTGYLNDWSMADKETKKPPTKKSEDTKYVNEKPGNE
ncbi:MAG: hypothetical protein M1833_004298 [Piccolia ochrophora]|nr:MAG: hypothetical protein M1833_004298 [Piccolia ochrophora]